MYADLAQAGKLLSCVLVLRHESHFATELLHEPTHLQIKLVSALGICVCIRIHGQMIKRTQ